MKIKNTIAIILIVSMFAIAIIAYDKVQLNEQGKMPVHWDSKGEINGYGSKFVGLFLLPIIALVVYLLFLIIPQIEVYKSHILEYNGQLQTMKIIFILFFKILYIATLLPSFGYIINMNYFIVPLISLLFIYLGYAIKDVKRNYFIGIRTPWTLASETVWKKTHNIGGKLFMIMGIIFLSSLLFPQYFIWILIVPLIIVIIFLFVYSYTEYKKINKK